MNISVLSLFDGISCGKLALGMCGTGVDAYYSSEINEYAIKVSSHNNPDIVQIGDVKNVNGNNFKGIDLLIGGSPCVDFSLHGKHNGMVSENCGEVLTLEQYLRNKDENIYMNESSLFWEFARVFREAKPTYFFLENVKMEKKWENIITETLGVGPISINSKKYSCQFRNRYYWTNIPNVAGYESFLNDETLPDVLENTVDDKYRLPYDEFSKITITDMASKKYIGYVNRGEKIPKFEDLIYCNGKIGTLCASDYKNKKKVFHNGTFRYLTPLEAERCQTIKDNYTDCIDDDHRYECIGNGWTVNVVASFFKNLK